MKKNKIKYFCLHDLKLLQKYAKKWVLNTDINLFAE